MKKFIAYLSRDTSYELEVEANSVEEVNKMWEDGDLDLSKMIPVDEGFVFTHLLDVFEKEEDE